MKTTTRGPVIAVIALALLLPVFAVAQDLHPSRQPSPMGMARITVDDNYMFVVYSRPYKRGRDNIFGTEASEALVPFDKIWRTGANAATQITFTGDVTVAGQTLAAGTYSLFTTPGESEWQVHFNSTLGMSGTGFFADGQFTAVDIPATNALSVTVPSGSVEEEVDQFTISFEEAEGGAHLVLTWITTQVRVPIGVGG